MRLTKRNKKIQVLLDPVKKKAYDDELRKEEMKSYFSQFRSQKVQKFILIFCTCLFWFVAA